MEFEVGPDCADAAYARDLSYHEAVDRQEHRWRPKQWMSSCEEQPDDPGDGRDCSECSSLSAATAKVRGFQRVVGMRGMVGVNLLHILSAGTI